jgi:hypothetical protein
MGLISMEDRARAPDPAPQPSKLAELKERIKKAHTLAKLPGLPILPSKENEEHHAN